jgi:hypothetical protein
MNEPHNNLMGALYKTLPGFMEATGLFPAQENQEPRETRDPDDFANAAQKAAGVTVTAADYLRCEAAHAAALTIAAAEENPDLALRMSARGPKSDFSREELDSFREWVSKAQAPWEKMGQIRDRVPGEEEVPIRNLYAWFHNHRFDAETALVRLATHLGWK